MTIIYQNETGLKFIIDVKLKSNNSFNVIIQLFSTRSPALIKNKFIIPYGHEGIIAPFDFNNLEEGIKNILAIMYKMASFDEFKQEDMIELIDILMMHEAPVDDIHIDDEYVVYKCVNM
ncbi:C1 protein [Croton yellow vein mosaic betasatellite[India:Barrackpore2:2008]]|uniref:C1 protein n=3 Tax=Croton yellow vein mosaic betasatellite TaxID=411248 RepID=C6KEC0_9VIRU|nr:C1 protein [Croton yellow vein mosaic betasatellite[India:Barrackpore1:2008]]ACS92540.1 C1 protein [Croton yellow vein mosaic betasatellite[India:Barrackpore2:2008]]ACS92541.1 C1 protein [Croton yellow vein mosaic betasatellite[India:Barrackpore3:2008]]